MRYDLLNDTSSNEKELIAKEDEFAFATSITNYKNIIYSVAYNPTKINVIAEEGVGSRHS